MHVQRLTAGDGAEWAKVGDGEIYVSDRVDLAAAPDAAMTVGFARVGAGESLEVTFPYDEVLVVTRGAYTVRAADGSELTARAGEVVYLPAGSTSLTSASEDAELVYVASPPGVYAEHVAAAA